MSEAIILKLISLGVESVVALPLFITTLVVAVKKRDSNWFVGAFFIAAIYIIVANATLLAH